VVYVDTRILEEPGKLRRTAASIDSPQWQIYCGCITKVADTTACECVYQRERCFGQRLSQRQDDALRIPKLPISPLEDACTSERVVLGKSSLSGNIANFPYQGCWYCQVPTGSPTRQAFRAKTLSTVKGQTSHTGLSDTTSMASEYRELVWRNRGCNRPNHVDLH
jgi:hypothetical protein